MFTGLVQSLGTVTAVRDDGHGGRELRVAAPPWATPLALGESIAVNGTCLTVVRFDADGFDFQAGPETLLKTTLGRVAAGDRVNLERALRVGDSIGGHFVSGHVDGVGTLDEVVPSGEWQTVWFRYPPALGELLVQKGSIAVDGVSLTLVDVTPERFSVMLIPHTLAHTTLGFKRPGDPVNLETDLLARHVRKLFQNLSLTI